VNFTVKAGQTLGVVGESGSGKSTLSKAILKLTPITSGKILWLGEDIVPLDEKYFRPKRREIQMIFQDPINSLNPRLKIIDIISEPLGIHEPQMKRQEREWVVVNLLEKVGLKQI
jgi:oligopeptide transport system ATP-binding protein